MAGRGDFLAASVCLNCGMPTCPYCDGCTRPTTPPPGLEGETFVSCSCGYSAVMAWSGEIGRIRSRVLNA